MLFFARGTSDNAAVYGSYLIQTRAGRLASLGSPSVATTYHSKLDLSGMLAVGLSQSGRTQEIIETLLWARDCGARLVAITNIDGSPLTELADVALVTEAGVEQAVPPLRRSLASSPRWRCCRSASAPTWTSPNSAGCPMRSAHC